MTSCSEKDHATLPPNTRPRLSIRVFSLTCAEIVNMHISNIYSRIFENNRLGPYLPALN